MAKEIKDPFGGHVTRRTIVGGPPAEEKTSNLQDKIEQLRRARAENADSMLLENEIARVRNETVKLDDEYYRMRNHLSERAQQLGGNVPPPNGNQQPAPFTGTTKLLVDIIDLGERSGLPSDVISSLVQQVITRNQYPGYGYPGAGLQPPAPAQPPQESVPGAILSTFGKIVEKSFDQTRTENPEIVIMREQMKMQEMIMNKELQSIKDILMEKNNSPRRNPNEEMADTVKSIGILMSTLRSIQPEAPAAAGDAELRFKYQDRQWQHEEEKMKAENQKLEIASRIQVEREKIEQSRQNLSQIPELIGGVLAQGIMEKTQNPPPQRPAPAQPQQINIEISKSKDKAHAPITIACPECGQPVSFVTSAKKAKCSSCQTSFNIILKETEGEQVSVEANRPADAPPISGYDEFSRGQ